MTAAGFAAAPTTPSAFAVAAGTTPVVSQVTIEGKVLPVFEFSCTSGAYGSVGHCQITTSRIALNASGINLVDDTVKASGPLPIVIQVGTSASQQVQIFVGEYDDAKWDYLKDTVTIHGRDLAGGLVDQKFVLSKGYANKTPDQLVIEIATQYGFTPMVTPVPAGPGGQLQTIGSLMGVSGSYMSYPRPVWDVLQSLAREVGYLLYVTPQRQMIFAPPDEDDTPLALSWNMACAPGVIPLMDLKPSYAPRRNKTFSVIVLSHYGQSAQPTQGTAVVAGEPIEIPGQTTIKAGIYIGAAGTRVRGLASSVLNGQPPYVHRSEGRTVQQCQSKAEAIARDIAKHVFKIDAVADGLPSLRLLQPLQLQGQVDSFLGRKLYVNSITHSMRVPDGPEHGQAGFVTAFSALSIPPTSISDPVELD